MPRLPEVGSADISDPLVKAIYSSKYGKEDFETAPGTSWGTKGNLETTLANSEPALIAAEHALRWCYDKSKFTLDFGLREIALLRVGWTVECKFVYSQRCKQGRLVGVSQEKIDEIGSWQVSALYSPVERAILAFVDSFVFMNGRVADGVFDALKSHLTPRNIIELCHAINAYIGYAKITRALRVEFDDAEDPMHEMPGPSVQAA